ncbi:hypothetical protein, partial [Microbacterium sp. ZXX196]|uniref:hypothetical protein n=1 Tax=Microbacterium sp. ZXX196 TaxID=2609291 RepID=UPI001E5918D7
FPFLPLLLSSLVLSLFPRVAAVTALTGLVLWVIVRVRVMGGDGYHDPVINGILQSNLQHLIIEQDRFGSEPING